VRWGPPVPDKRDTLPSCPVCGGEGALWFAKEQRRYLKCSDCRSAYIAEGLLLNAAGQTIYEGDSEVFFEDGNEDYYLSPTALKIARKKAEIAHGFAPDGGRLLDIGAGFGHFVSAAAPYYDAEGLELSARAAEWGRNTFGVKVASGTIVGDAPDIGDNFDVITSWDVIEHLDDPKAALMAISARLKPGGHLILSTPDIGSLAAKLTGQGWWYLDPVQHVILFNRNSLASLLQGAGFDVLDVTSMGHWYELTYVFSRLSHLYRNGIIGRLSSGCAKVAAKGPQIFLPINPFDVMVLHARKK